MFTGLVEAIGTVTSLLPLDATDSGGSGTSLTISITQSEDPEFLKTAQLGDSICINGTCLTVTELVPNTSPHSFKVGISPETLRRTNLGSLKEKDRANLERALLPNTRLGGHFLQGHVDTVATIGETREDGNAVVFRLIPREQGVLRYIVEKGYVALDGASLTVTEEGKGQDGRGWFEVMLIAYTQERIVMGKKQAGDEVNIEVDMVGKYVEKSVAGYFEGSKSSGDLGALEKIVNRMVDERVKSLK